MGKMSRASGVCFKLVLGFLKSGGLLFATILEHRRDRHHIPAPLQDLPVRYWSTAWEGNRLPVYDAESGQLLRCLRVPDP